MGFEIEDYKLVWPEGSRWHNLEVYIRGMSIAELRKIAELREAAKDADEAKRLDALSPMIDIIQGAIISWNAERKGVPIPVSEFGNQDYTLINAVIDGWMGTLEVPDPLEKNSSDGNPSDLSLIPMEIPSSSNPGN